MKYRILEVCDPQLSHLVGRELDLLWRAKRLDLPRGFCEAEGRVLAFGQIHFSSGVRIKRIPPPPCYCARHSFPHRKTKECLAWLDAQT